MHGSMSKIANKNVVFITYCHFWYYVVVSILKLLLQTAKATRFCLVTTQHYNNVYVNTGEKSQVNWPLPFWRICLIVVWSPVFVYPRFVLFVSVCTPALPPLIRLSFSFIPDKSFVGFVKESERITSTPNLKWEWGGGISYVLLWILLSGVGLSVWR